jgi:spore germination protein KC
MKVKWIIQTFLLLWMVSFLTGCWNKRELNEMAIVMAMGIDKVEETGEYRVTFQVVNPGAVATGATGGGSGGNTTPVTVFSGTEKTIFKAVRKTSQKVPRQLFFAHIQLLIIGETIAKEGIQDLFDFFERNPETRMTTKVLVTRDVKAGTMLKILTPVEKIPVIGIAKQNELAEKIWAENVNIELIDVVKGLESEGREPIISGVKIVGDLEEGKKNSNLEQTDMAASAEIEGVALFKEGKLRRWLDGDKVRGLLWIQNKIESSIITTDCKDEKEAIGIEIVRAKTGVTAEVLAGKPIIHIHIRQEGYVGEVECSIDLTKKEEITKLEQEWVRETKKQVMETVKVAQSEKSDIFGFGEAVNRANPKEWEKMKKEWDKAFAESRVDVKVDAFIRLPGKRNNPLELK